MLSVITLGQMNDYIAGGLTERVTISLAIADGGWITFGQALTLPLKYKK